MFHTVQKARLVGNNWPQYRTMSLTNESREQPTQSRSRYEIRETIGPRERWFLKTHLINQNPVNERYGD